MHRTWQYVEVACNGFYGFRFRSFMAMSREDIIRPAACARLVSLSSGVQELSQI